MAKDPRLLLLHAVDLLRTGSAFFASKRVLARLLSTFLCCIVVIIQPFSVLGGSYAFLVLALKELVFSVQDSLAQQLELTILNIIGAMVGIGVSTLAKFIAAQYPENSARSRATCACFLVFISFFGKSPFPVPAEGVQISPCFSTSWSHKEPPSPFESVYAHLLLCFDMDTNNGHRDTFCEYILF